MKKSIIILIIMLFQWGLQAQNFDNLTFGTDSTLEVVTWNIEWFPKNGTTTINYVTQIIKALDVDILAIQEIKDTNAFKQMMSNLDGFDYYFRSGYFAGLGYIYKTEFIEINDIYQIYTTNPYWRPFPRAPMVIDFNFQNQNYIVFDNHFKCCGDGSMNLNNPDDEETRRYEAANLLKEYIDTHFADKNVMIVGDLNDLLEDNEQNNVFKNIINDFQNYYFATSDIVTGTNANWSYPSWPSHLDHIIITNELFDEFENESSVVQTIRIDDYFSSWSQYDKYVSDHRPVGFKFTPNATVGLNKLEATKKLTVRPNPFRTETTFEFETLQDNTHLEIYDIRGQLIFTDIIQAGEGQYTWSPTNGESGVYFSRLRTNSETTIPVKLLIIR
ncbi:MAG: endonuclease/exonuclease/phosphatase family protein [Salinivirgaceae bacterium]|nr:endonuclease/exonuclease/phosphatase family protein [Salinivirgaceae bacterium]